MNFHNITVEDPTEDDQPVSLSFLKSLKQYFLVSTYYIKSMSNQYCFLDPKSNILVIPFDCVLEKMNIYFIKKETLAINYNMYIVFNNDINTRYNNIEQNQQIQTLNINRSLTTNTHFSIRLSRDSNFSSSPRPNEISFTLVFSKSLL